MRNQGKTPSTTIHAPVDADEMYAVIGLWIRLGITGFCGESIRNIFSLRPDSSLDAHLVFSRERYELLISAFRFDIKSARQKDNKGKYLDKFVHLRRIWDLFFRNCRDAVADLGRYITIDESLIGYRGRCGIRVYNPSKPAKYGILVYNAVDAISKYVYNAIPYVREPNLGNFGQNVS